MDVIFYLFAATVTIGGLLTSIAIWSPRATWIRVTASLLAVLFLPLSYIGFASLLSKPKPKNLAWFERNVEKAAVLGASFEEGVAIYLWLRLDNSLAPRYYVLPWNQSAAEKLEETMEAAVKTNTSVIIIKPFSKDVFEQWGDLNIKIVPPATLPMKPPRFPARIFNPRSPNI